MSLKVNKINSSLRIDKKNLLVLLSDAACQLDAFSGLECMSAHIESIEHVARWARICSDLPVGDNLPDDPEMLKAMLLAERHESERLHQIIKELQRHRFGRKAETLPEEQMLLGLEDVQQVAACMESGQDETAPEGSGEARTQAPRQSRSIAGASDDRSSNCKSTPYRD
jgi:hypothetical protein